jgi:hypothetical protein
MTTALATDHAASNLRAIAAMLAGQATFTVNDALIKLAAEGMPGGQAIFMRGVMAFAVAFTICAAVGGLKFATLRGQGRILTLRNIGEIGSTLFYLSALFHLPIATTTAILQFIPLAITASAAIFLAEPVGWRRWLATAVGFFGVMLIIRPGSDSFSAYTLLALIGVGFSVLRDLSTRRINRQVPAILLVTISAATVTIGDRLRAVRDVGDAVDEERGAARRRSGVPARRVFLHGRCHAVGAGGGGVALPLFRDSVGDPGGYRDMGRVARRDGAAGDRDRHAGGALHVHARAQG